MSNRWRRICAGICALVILLAAGCTFAEETDQRNLRKMLAYIDENKPMELELRELMLKPTEIAQLREHMPEGAVLHFTTKWLGVSVSDTDEELDLKAIRRRPALAEMEQLIRLLPGLRKVDISGGHRMYNEDMIRLTEEFPDIAFIWKIELNSRHRNLCTTDTAYSMFNSPLKKSLRVTSQQLELLQYAPGLKALDLGHNAIQSLDFLRFFPDLELLILADNPIRDIEMIGTLKHLKYLEIFNTQISDLSPLANCTELLDLNLSYCSRVKDLSPLDSLPALERFWGVEMRGLSREEKARFTAAMPRTEINFTAEDATAGGWREHPRYTHYVECLKNHQWISFDEIKTAEE